jgi:hypothetical protein
MNYLKIIKILENAEHREPYRKNFRKFAKRKEWKAGVLMLYCHIPQIIVEENCSPNETDFFPKVLNLTPYIENKFLIKKINTSDILATDWFLCNLSGNEIYQHDSEEDKKYEADLKKLGWCLDCQGYGQSWEDGSECTKCTGIGTFDYNK